MQADSNTTPAGPKKDAPTAGLRTIVAASSAGTAFEWYDFFIFGTLTSIIAKNFFAGLNETAGFILTLATFALGFIARPVGALVFGHIGDRKGRKGTFLVTILIMGLATVAIGLLPTYSMVGLLAPVLLVLLRVLQGFALGGEYGGAAIYVAEHAPANKRGLYTGWIQTSAAFGLISALLVILATRRIVGEAAFTDWGWRIPFVISAGLLAISVYIRAKTAESPAFKAMQDEGRITATPFKDSFGRWSNLKRVLIALFGFMTAQGVVWYTSFFYTQVFMEKIVKLDGVVINWLIVAMTAVSAFLYIAFAALSDRIGRKPVMLFGMALAALGFFPGFSMILNFGNPALAMATKRAPVVVVVDPSQCTFQFDPTATAVFATPCDVARSVVTGLGVPHSNETTARGTAFVEVGLSSIEIPSGAGKSPAEMRTLKADVTAQVKAALATESYPERADPQQANLGGIFIVLCVFAVACTALYGPMASLLVEMFPTSVRYTGLSLPYNIGTGWFGGLLPAVSFAMVAATGDVNFGLWYPVITTIIAIIVSLLFLKETHGRDLHTIEH